MLKNLIVVACVLTGGALGYAVPRPETARPETARLRKQVEVLKSLVREYQEELAYVERGQK